MFRIMASDDDALRVWLASPVCSYTGIRDRLVVGHRVLGVCRGVMLTQSCDDAMKEAVPTKHAEAAKEEVSREWAAKVDAAERRAIAGQFIEMTGLTGFGDRYPHELSGGMRQRVGIARALTTRPKALLMDEPFGALDAQTRGKLQDELLEIWEKQRTTVLFVTHSIDEALLLADRILVFSPRPGRIAADIKVDLPRPRVSQSPGFTALARELRGLVGADREID